MPSCAPNFFSTARNDARPLPLIASSVLDQSRAALGERPHTLILHEAAFAVDAVPVVNRVERERRTAHTM